MQNLKKYGKARAKMSKQHATSQEQNSQKKIHHIKLLEVEVAVESRPESLERTMTGASRPMKTASTTVK